MNQTMEDGSQLNAQGLNMNFNALGKIMAPASAKFRQFQQMVQDIHKNEDSFLSKLRRLKMEQRPDLPARDYRDDSREVEHQLSEASDNDMYEDPREEDNYEPPPSHQEFTTTPAAPPSVYLDSCLDRPSRPPRKPVPSGKASKQLPPEPAHQDSDDDYLNPDVCNGDDDYIQPTENPPPNPLFNKGRSLPLLPSHLPSHQPKPDFHKAPESKENSLTLPKSRSTVSPRMCVLPQKPRRRLSQRRSPPPVREPTADDEYEVCDSNNGCDETPAEKPLLPIPLPRERSPKPPLKLRVEVKPRPLESRTLPAVHADQKISPKSFPQELTRPKIPFIRSTFSKPTEEQSSTENETQEKDADIVEKPWFAATCCRKTAEDVLVHLNKDGGFLVRNSSGHVAQHPYTLVVFFNDRVYNIPIRFISSTQMYALGSEKQGEEHFTSVSHIIENHQKNPLVLIDSQSNSKDATKLLYPTKP
ncbi:B-cell linker protein [Gouania willdenowi]|uniref:B-cell linker protein n=1 Tax=Gouania willdenowi TaxID=441366 RepID=UPI0010565BA4|nr:B-cell linker protein-like [Gouania willdenowi]